jgi:hypothetical protein
MSLEQVIADLTAAIRETNAQYAMNIARMLESASVGSHSALEALKPVMTYHVESTKDNVSTIVARIDGLPVLVKPDEKAAPEVPYVMPALQPREAVVEAPAAVEYAQVAQAIIDSFKVDRTKVIAALGKFGAKKGPELKVGDYAAFLAELA